MNMKTLIFSAFLVIGIMALAGKGQVANKNSKRSGFDDGLSVQIKAATDKWRQLVSGRNADSLARRYKKDCVYMKQGEPSAYHRKDVRDLYHKWFNTGIISCDVTSRGFRELSGKHAYVWGEYTSYAKGRKGQGKMIAETGTFVQLFEREKGGFQIIVEGRTVNDVRSGGMNNTSTC